MKYVLVLLAILAAAWIGLSYWSAQELGSNQQQQASDREEVIFWHFWGGADRDVVDDVVRRFNESQDRYQVRAIAMPGNNLDVKLFLSITGEDPPDVVNQDDPIVADWASRDALVPLSEVASKEEQEELTSWLFPAARRLGEYDRQLYALCNGLDIRALYINETWLEQEGLSVPVTLDELNNIADTISPPGSDDYQRFAYLPDSRRLWAWGYVFGGDFTDSRGELTFTDPKVVQALEWMTGFSKRYGPQRVAAFRAGDQSLPGKIFPLLPISNDEVRGRYAMIMDGQWRCRDIESFQELRRQQGGPVPQFTVAPLPPPDGGVRDAGWVNGNFFVIPKGARCPEGAWEFMKFWSGFQSHEKEAAETCQAGGWIPVSPKVVARESFQNYLNKHPLFAEFVRLAGSENQHPIPVMPGAPRIDRELKAASERAMGLQDGTPMELLTETEERLRRQLNRNSERSSQ